MRKEEFGIRSKDQRHILHGIIWIPEGEVKAVLQVVHGMVEFIDRYDGFARYLCGLGIAVIGHDHLGHGLTAGRDEDLGYFAREGGEQLIIEDMYQVTEEMRRRFPSAPHFIMGHSMGSFCLRKYLTFYAGQVDGAIIMGTGDFPLLAARCGKLAAGILMRWKGRHYRSKRLAAMVFNGYLKGIDHPRTPEDWLTKDEAVVDAYRKNKFNTFIFTVSAYHDFFEIIEYDTRMTGLDRIPKKLPLFIVSGDRDPVGSWGSGPRRLYEKYRKKGFQDVRLKLYENDRHEILNETDRRTVYEDLGEWLLEKSRRVVEDS
ncbi:MAG: alpha/beta hydrolase [Lachnospiraceae bacterium]|nr:alpha/beta hydrolase [Lachnospiraceae bacterium]